jgi:hypothetical protein
MLNFSDSRNFGRTLAAISLFVTPILLLLGTLVSPDTSDDAAKALADIADHKAGYVIGGILFLIAPLVFIPGMLGTMRLMRRRRVTMGQVGAALILLGALITVSFYGFGAMEYVAATDSGLDRAQMANLVDSAEDSALNIPIFIGFTLGLILGSILLAIALWRSRVVPVWAAAALVISTVLGFFAESLVLGVLSFVFLFAALAPIGRKILSIPDHEWDRWQLPERSPAAGEGRHHEA